MKKNNRMESVEMTNKTQLCKEARDHLDKYLTEDDKKELLLLTISQNTNAKVILSPKVRKVMDEAMDIQVINEQSKKKTTTKPDTTNDK